MREPDFKDLTTRLLRKGITPKHAHRTVNELRDHYDDLVDAAVDNGASSRNARRLAAEQLGSGEDLVRAMASRRELKTWSFRYPRLAIAFYPLACVAVLPAVPVVAGIEHRTVLARWGASLIAAGVVTALMLLTLRMSIYLG